MKVSRLLRDYHDAGSLNALLAIWGFIDDRTFLTKAGHLGVVFRLAGVDYEGLTHAQRADFTHRVEAALRLLDDRCRLYQYVIKRAIEPVIPGPCRQPVVREAIEQRASYLNGRRHELYCVDHFVVLLLEREISGGTSTKLLNLLGAPREALRDWLSTSRTLTVLQRTLDEATASLHQKADAFAVQLADFGLRQLPKDEVFAFLRRLLNFDPAVLAASRLLSDTHVDYFLTDSAVDCHRDHLAVGGRLVKVLSMKEPPGRTFANLMADLIAVPGELIACLEWQRIPNDRVRRDIKSRQRHFFNKRVSLVNYLGTETRPEEMLVDDSANAVVGQLGSALTELEVNGRFFGSCSLSVALVADDSRGLQQQAAEAVKVMSVHDGSFFEETYNLLNAWLSMIPGNASQNVRHLTLLETNVADLSFVFTLDTGDLISPHLRQPALAMFETPHHTPYAFNLHVNDVGHTLVLGATGSGKSFLLNFLVTHAQQYEPLTVILDLGHSYRKLAALLRGRYLEVGLGHREVTINPFGFEPTPEHLHFLHAFVRVLLEGEDGYRLTEREDREVYEAIENLHVLDRTQRRLFTLANLLPRPLAARMHKWVDGGRYAALFDNLDDTLTLERLQVFDFEAMHAYPALLEPLLFYVLHRVTTRIRDSKESGLKLCVLDEAWRFIQHPTLRAYVQEGLKTWRKHNAAMILATQAVDDFASVDLLRTVVESCPTKLFLANPALDARQYCDLFQLNEMELSLLGNLIPRQQILLKRPGLAKVLTLTVDPKSYWIYTNTPQDNERAAAAFRNASLNEGLDRPVASAS